jgi:hypothetical protein
MGIRGDDIAPWKTRQQVDFGLLTPD